MMLTQCFCKDADKYLYVNYYNTKQHHFKDPAKFINCFNNQLSPGLRNQFFKDIEYLNNDIASWRRGFSSFVCLKNDLYNFENTIENLKNDLKIVLRHSFTELLFPIYILKDEWHYCSPETDMLLLPCLK